jgi:carbon monoxide dehydrogenase subunit G
MDMTGEYRIPATRQHVWDALNDPTVLSQCIPGCEEIVKLSDVEWTAKVVAKVGPVKAKFGGKVTLSDLDPPNGYKITGEGTGGAAGFAKGGATVNLSDLPEGTLLSYVVQANVGGKLAQIGSRLIDGASRKMADEFFAKFATVVGESGAATMAPDKAPAAAAAPAAPPIEATTPEAATAPAAEPVAAEPAQPRPTPTPTPAPAPPPPAATPSRGGLSPVTWVIALAVLIAILLYFFTR